MKITWNITRSNGLSENITDMIESSAREDCGVGTDVEELKDS